MLSNGSKTNNNSVLMGDETTVLAQYYIFEWFEKDKDKRHDSTNLQKQSFREFGSEHIAVFVREMHKQIPSKYFVEKDNHGRFKAEEFRANNTLTVLSFTANFAKVSNIPEALAITCANVW